MLPQNAAFRATISLSTVGLLSLHDNYPSLCENQPFERENSHTRHVRVQPTLSPYQGAEFCLRAARLIKTAGKVVFTYKLLPDSESEAKVNLCSERLKKAQKEYTGDGSSESQSVKSKELTEELRQRVYAASQGLAEAESELRESGAENNKNRKAAKHIVDLCRLNGGCYIKVGQHLANLDYLLPQEFIEEMRVLYNDNPVSEFDRVKGLIEAELGAAPEELFSDFETEPLASASLAQVHVATLKESGRKIALKVQHPSVKRTGHGDIFALTKIVRFVERNFVEFKFGWLVEEIAPQLYKELDFVNEAENGRKAKELLEGKFGSRVVVPEVLGEFSSERVLCMSFEEGFCSTDLKQIERNDLNKADCAELISEVFCYQVFSTGFVHCDPHPANVMLRKGKNGKPTVVLVDHGLYKTLPIDFRVTYCDFWVSTVTADIPLMKVTCAKMNVGKMFPLLAAMITARPFDEVLDRRRSGLLGLGGSKEADKERKERKDRRKKKREDRKKGLDESADAAMLRGYAVRFMGEILKLLEDVPRELPLLLKMNDCLRHIDHALGQDKNSNLEVCAKWASSGKLKAILEDKRKGLVERMRAIFSHWLLLLRVKVLFGFLLRS